MSFLNVHKDGVWARGPLGSILSFHSPTLLSRAGRSLLGPCAARISLPCPLPSPQSRMVRNEIPYFIWTTRRDVLDCRFLSKDQMINHYARAGSFTTKVGSPGRGHGSF